MPNPTGWVDPLGLVSEEGSGCPKKKKANKSKVRDNREFDTREEAEAAIFNKAGIDLDTPPDVVWEVGGDKTRIWEIDYVFDKSKESWGFYRQYETAEGSKVIVEHTGEEFNHFHSGIPKKEPNEPIRELVDFGWGSNPERYAQTESHHYYYEKVTNLKLRRERGLPELKE